MEETAALLGSTVWRCLERHNVFKEKQEELLDEVLKLLEDSSKDVRDAAITALEQFYTYIGPSLLSDLEYKNIRAAHMKTLTGRFERIPTSNDTSVVNGALPDELSSILSSYGLQVSSSSSSMARYLASIRSRTANEAKTAEGDQSPHLESTSSTHFAQDFSTVSSFGANDISEKEVQKQLDVIFDKLQLDNNWDKHCANKEACQTIQTLANTLKDEFNSHAEICLGNLLKATYVTIQVISTSADTTIRSIIESTRNGYVRVIPKHSDLFVPIMPAILQDALGDVRAQSRKCYWAYHHLFPNSSTSTKEKKIATAGPQRVLNAPKPAQSNTTAESVYTSRQEPSTAGFHTSSQATKAQRIQHAQAPVPMEIDDIEPRGPKRLPLVSLPSPTASNASSSKTNNSRSDSTDKPKRAASTKASERPKVAPLPAVDQLEEALANIESRSWSTRLEAVEYIGNLLQQRVDRMESGASADDKVGGRILMAFLKHLSDPHYRVSQGVLNNLLPLLKLSTNSQRLVPHLKTVLPKLFQKFIDTKESIRLAAKENLEYVSSTVDSATLAAIVISMLGDGSNMKVKAAICHYLRELLPGAGGYMKNGVNNSHMRSFLLKIALLMDTDVPVSVSSACGNLVAVAAQLYGPEMEVALSLLPPSKRLVVSKVLKDKRIILNFSNPPRPPFSMSQSDHDNQETIPHAPKPERSRKRPESPSASSSSPSGPSSQKRINTSQPVETQRSDVQLISPGVDKRSSSFSSVVFPVDTQGPQLEDLLHLLEQKDLPETEMKRALYKMMQFINTGSSETWDRCFGRLLLLLLDAATEKNVYALKVLQRLVEAQPSRAQTFFELLLQRLIDAMASQVDLARHLMERILRVLVTSASDLQQTLLTLISLVDNRKQPTLEVLLRLVKVCLQANSNQDPTFLRRRDVTDRILKVLTQRLTNDGSSSVRKSAVDCLVAFHFATEDKSIVPKYISVELDETRRKLVEIFIDRAKMKAGGDDLIK
eukprot:jgi/Phyca11/536333/estExt2_fgenesh1_pg.C_PHYCAscaffold_510016